MGGAESAKLVERWGILEVIDTWNMTVTAGPGALSGRVTIELPRRPYIAVRIRT
jgi:hypothetical protein